MRRNAIDCLTVHSAHSYGTVMRVKVPEVLSQMVHRRILRNVASGNAEVKIAVALCYLKSD